MTLLNWSSYFALGIDQIDDQHKKLVEMLNDMYDGIKSGHAEDVLKVVLDRLLRYTRSHFLAEEKYMMEIGYPGFDDHFKRHYELNSQVEELVRKHDSGEHVNYLEVVTFLRDWLQVHIMEEDMQIAKYAVSKEAKML